MQYARRGLGGQAEPEWDRFANEIGRLVLDEADGELLDAINYLFEHPPKMQILQDGVLSWQNVNKRRTLASDSFRPYPTGKKQFVSWWQVQRSLV